MQIISELPVSSIELLSPEAINFLKLILMIDIYAPTNKNEHIQKWDKKNPAIQELLKHGYIEHKSTQGLKHITLTKEIKADERALLSEVKKIVPNMILKIHKDTPKNEISNIMREITTKKHKKETDQDGNPIPYKNFGTSDRLLRPSDALDTPEWFMFVPKWFNTALGISLETRRKHLMEYQSWVQSGLFAFKDYDIIYKDKKNWIKGLTNYIRIEKAYPVSIMNGDRYPGHVSFSIHGNFIGSITKLEMTQDDFVLFLVTGIWKRKDV